MALTKSPRIKDALENIGIRNFLDVIFHLPRTYDDFTLTKEPFDTEKGRVTLFGQIISIPRIVKANKVTLVTFSFQSTSGYTYRVTAFNRPYLINTLKYAQEVTLVATFDGNKRELNLVKLVDGKLEEDKKFQSVYSLPSSIKNFEYQRLVEKAFKEGSEGLVDLIPPSLSAKYRLLGLKEAYRRVHFPKGYEDVALGLRTLKYEEALIFQLKNALIRKANKSLNKEEKTSIDLKRVNDFIQTLPYKLTSDQINAVREIGLDMNEKTLMYRLLQGDVGTGKTLVAFISLYINYLRGEQGVLMAPTDILARQHFENALNIFKGTALKIELLVGSLKEKEKNELKRRLIAGDIDLLIGTHALFTEDVAYKNLGLVVIDEQHRFGVNQRNLLVKKGEHADLLLMSATPIPRSLALTLYGDLDLTTIKTFPFRKREVETKIIGNNQLEIKKAINAKLAEGKRVFIVAPRIEGEEANSVETLVEIYKKQFPNLVTFVHGKMSVEEKEEAIRLFKSGTTPILVATSVIEVGVDVKNAALMLIYSPLSFGLSQLHQLRGRIGRDGTKALCLLVSEDEDVDKLKILEESEDGFKIAEADLSLRGPGEIIGVKQSGIPHFNSLNLVSDYKLFQIAREDALMILNHSENPEFKAILSHAKKEINTDIFTNV